MDRASQKLLKRHSIVGCMPILLVNGFYFFGKSTAIDGSPENSPINSGILVNVPLVFTAFESLGPSLNGPFQDKEEPTTSGRREAWCWEIGGNQLTHKCS